jgi:predicted unusual protein kinase regulating ubiquinone biosynthesis (AarF/ABC1/UbiB family)
VLDFGSVGHPAGAFTDLFARTFKLAAEGDLDAVRDLWMEVGMVAESTSTEELSRILAIDITPYTDAEFRFSSEWMTGRAEGWNDPAASMQDVGKLAFPPGLLLEHRAVTGMLALLTSISATVDFRAVLDETLTDR